MRQSSAALATALVLLVAVVTTARVINVPEKYIKIGAALHDSHEDDTVLLSPGVYKELIDLPDRVSLIGTDRTKVIIVGRENHPVIRVGDQALVKNVTIKGGSAGIRSENKMMRIEGNIITENRETGIHCLVSLPSIRNNIIIRNDWTGIYCEHTTGLKTSIEHNIIAENKYSGITLSGKSELLVRNNMIVNNGKYAVWVSKQSRRARIEFNNLYNNRRERNQYAIISASNTRRDPEFPTVRADVFDYLQPARRSFEGAGKGGATIGLVSDSELARDAGDKDRDGVMDEIDQCKGVAEDRDGFEDDDGCPEFDNDMDGIYDSQDRCDDKAEDMDGFEDLDGCPDPDNDKDKVLDKDDSCPDKPETMNGFKDDDGCPDAKPD